MPWPKSVTGYRFLDKDPVIDVFREAKRVSGLSNQQIASESGVSPSTIQGWDIGRTKKPQHATLRSAMEACGFKESWVGKEHAITYDYIGKKLKSRQIKGE